MVFIELFARMNKVKYEMTQALLLKEKGGRGGHTMQFVALNVAKVELDSTSATVVRNVARSCTVCPV